MVNQPSRRDFLRQGITVGTGIVCCCISFSCSKQSRQKAPIQSQKPQKQLACPDFGKLAYCSFECNEKNCKVFRATKNEDKQAKAKIAKQWSEKYNKDFKAEDVACYGCKTENVPLSQFAELCNVRKCAKEKKVVTCAHCDDFPTCEKELWTEWPKLREKTNEMRSKLQTQSKT